MPPYATVEIQYERGETEEKIEIELTWKRKQE
jgi:hypothetical protein